MDELFSSAELLSGLVGRRANSLLFLIESRTAVYMHKARKVTAGYIHEELAKDQEMQFLEAFSHGKPPPLRPTIQDIERFSPLWANLIPNQPRLKAALAHLLGQKYTFSYQSIPQLRDVLGLDTQDVCQQHLGLYQQPLSCIYSVKVTAAERIRWSWSALSAWFENLPPFWIVFSLTLTETVGGGILALPAAVAAVGPLPGIFLVFIIGLLYILTINYFAEANVRNSSMRSGNSSLGRLLKDYLGTNGSIIITLSASLILALVLLAYYIGIVNTITAVIPVPALLLVLGLFMGGLYFITAGGMKATFLMALLIGFINIFLLLLIILLAFSHIRLEHLLYTNIPFLSGLPIDKNSISAMIGVITMVFYGHLSVSSCARSVLERDPGGRSLIYGSIAALAVSMFIYILWIVAVGGALAPEVIMLDKTGTALLPLAQEVAPLVNILGSVFVLLSMGMGTLQGPFLLAGLVMDFLPAREKKRILLPQRQARLEFTNRGKKTGLIKLTIVYLGLQDSQPRLRLDLVKSAPGAVEKLERYEILLRDHWDLASIQPDLPRLEIKPDQITPTALELALETDMRLHYVGKWETSGLSLADLISKDPDQQKILTWMIRAGSFSLSTFQKITGYTPQDAQLALDLLMAAGQIVRADGDADAYRVFFKPKMARKMDQSIWDKVKEPTESSGRNAGILARLIKSGGWASLLHVGWFRRLVSIFPLMLIALLALWSIYVQSIKLGDIFGFIGIILASIIIGVIPVLLLIACRNKGDRELRFNLLGLGNPIILAVIYLFSWSIPFIHGVFIWENPFQRAAAIIISAYVIFITLRMLKTGVFGSRAAIDLCLDSRKLAQNSLQVFVSGQKLTTFLAVYSDTGTAQIASQDLHGLQISHVHSLTVDPLHIHADELSIAARHINPDGDVEELSGVIELLIGSQSTKIEMSQAVERYICPCPKEAFQVVFTLKPEKTSSTLQPSRKSILDSLL